MSSGDVGKPTVSTDEEADEALESMKFNFNIESLGLVLYSNDPKQVSQIKDEDLAKRNGVLWAVLDLNQIQLV